MLKDLTKDGMLAKGIGLTSLDELICFQSMDFDLLASGITSIFLEHGIK